MASYIATTLLTLALLPTALSQVTATFPNGVTNPAQPSLAAIGSTVNQTSFSRLLSLDSLHDFCLYGPPEPGPNSLIGNVEPIVVAYCTQPRNGARLIPDGTISGAQFIKTPLYVQVQGFWDGTKINIPNLDDGGELDPHGAENLGNPIGGNVTSNVSGQNVFYEEWMQFISYNQFCFRICTAQTSNITTALQCEHELDVMGCQFVMPGTYADNQFTSCEGDAAAPPGLYPQANGSVSTFRQRYTGTYTDGAGAVQQFTVGQTVTPASVYSIPATSNCVSYATISNGIGSNFVVSAYASTPSTVTGPITLTSGSSMATMTGSSSSRSSSATSGTGSTSRASSSSAPTSRATTASGTAAAATTSAASSAMLVAGNSGMGLALGLGAVGVVLGGMAVWM